MNDATQRLTEARAKRDALEDEIHKLGALAEAGTMTDGQSERFERQVAAHARAKADVIEAELEVRNGKMAEIKRGIDNGTVTKVSGDGARRDNAPRHTGDSLRSQALRAVDSLERAPEAARHALAGAIDTAAAYEDPAEMDALSRWTVVASDDHYARAFDKVFRDPQYGHREFTGPEVDAWQNAQRLQRAMSLGSVGAGAALLPTHLDPAIIVSSGSSPKNVIGELCSTAIIATKTWNGVSAGLVSASIDAEAAEVSDDTPTFAQPSIPTGRLTGFIPVSFEAFEDTNISQQVGALFAESFDWLIGQHFTTGSGANGGPTGIVTALDGTGQEIAQAAGEAISRADTFALQEALLPRWRSNAKWQMSLPILNDVREFPRLTTGTEVPLIDDSGDRPKLLNWDVYVNDAMDSSINAAATADNFVIVVGDWSRYQAVYRVGTTIELIPHLFGTAANLPTGQRGYYCRARVGGDTTVDSAFVMLNVATTA